MSGIKEKILGFKTRLRKFRAEFADEFTYRVMARTPVDTGRLQSGWEWRMKDQDIEIRNDVEYASFVEQGTERMSGAHMLAVTMEEAEQIAELALERAERGTK